MTRLPGLFIFTGLFILIFALVKIIEEARAGLPKQRPGFRDDARTRMDADYLRRCSGNGYIRIPTRLGQARGIA